MTNEISSYDVAMNAMSGSAASSISLDVSSFNTANVEEYAITVMGKLLLCSHRPIRIIAVFKSILMQL